MDSTQHVVDSNRLRTISSRYLFPPGAPDPILAKRVSNFAGVAGDQVQVVVRNCSCSSVWCKDCYRRKGGSRRFAEKLAKMDFKKVRQVVLTVDPKKFPSGPQVAFEYLRDRKALPDFIRDLQRYGGVDIARYQWVLEWHTNGYPHWHVFIETTTAGKKGMIGVKKLLRFWRHGIVREQPIRSEKHWKAIVGYFGAMGYFQNEKKDHQLELPEWALYTDYRIRKTGGSELLTGEHKKSDDVPADEKKESEPKPFPGYSVVLATCRANSVVEVRRGRVSGKISAFFYRLKVPFDLLKKYPGTEYRPGVGYVFQSLFADFHIWLDYVYLISTGACPNFQEV